MKRGSTLLLKGVLLALCVVFAVCVFARPAIWRAVAGEFYGIILALFVAAVLQRLFQQAIDIKSANDLTV